MPRERLPMRKISDVLRLHAGGLSKRRIAVSLNIGRTAVGDYINRARRAGLGWPLAEDLWDEDLERLLFPPPVAVSPDRRSLPDWPVLHRELKRPGVTLSLLWEEYRAVHRDGYGYSRFAMQDGDDDIVGLGRDCAVDNEKVAVENPGIAHGLALRADEKGRRRAADQMQIEIKLALDMVVGGAWKSGGYPGAVKRQGEFGGLIGETLQGGGPQCCLEHNMNKQHWLSRSCGVLRAVPIRTFLPPGTESAVCRSVESLQIRIRHSKRRLSPRSMP